MLGAMECPTQWACSARHSQIPISHSLSHPVRPMQGNPTPLAHTRRPAMLPWRRVSSTIPPAVPAPIVPGCIQLRANGSAGSRAYRSIPDLFSFFPLPLYNQFPPISPPTLISYATKEILLDLVALFFFLFCAFSFSFLQTTFARYQTVRLLTMRKNDSPRLPVLRFCFTVLLFPCLFFLLLCSRVPLRSCSS